MIADLTRFLGRSLTTFAAVTAAHLAGTTPAQACTLCSCSASTPNVSFGTYDATAAAPDDTVGTISVDCTGLIALLGTIEISASPGSSGNAMARTMRQGQDRLDYNLFVDPARTLVFGNGAGGTRTIVAPLNGLLIFRQAVPVFGRIPPRQKVRAGNYADSIVITVVF